MCHPYRESATAFSLTGQHYENMIFLPRLLPYVLTYPCLEKLTRTALQPKVGKRSGDILSRVNNEERVSNAPLPYKKHSRESNAMCT